MSYGVLPICSIGGNAYTSTESVLNLVDQVYDILRVCEDDVHQTTAASSVRDGLNSGQLLRLHHLTLICL